MAEEQEKEKPAVTTTTKTSLTLGGSVLGTGVFAYILQNEETRKIALGLLNKVWADVGVFGLTIIAVSATITYGCWKRTGQLWASQSKIFNKIDKLEEHSFQVIGMQERILDELELPIRNRRNKTPDLSQINEAHVPKSETFTFVDKRDKPYGNRKEDNSRE